jgi:metal-dependent amidase/aminoacylase/carboxypeptidase family protein
MEKEARYLDLTLSLMLYRMSVTVRTKRFPLREACGHNLIAVVGVAAAAGLKAAMKACNISGTVKLVGSPGELNSIG